MTVGATPGRDVAGPARGVGQPVVVRSWVAFFGLAAAVVAPDQAAKAWIVGTFELGTPVAVLGDLVRIWYVHNSGGLFGMFGGQAPLFALASVAVIGLIVWYHGRAVTDSGWLATLALGLLLGGAIGNLVDRVRFGYVVDFVDMGIGGWRFYTYNVADAAISTSILLLIVMAFLPHRPHGRDG
jgi:signal peptidase II